MAVNGVTRLHDLDTWKLVGVDHALKKTLNVQVTGGQLMISFPTVQAGEAVISAIGIATPKENVKPAPGASLLITMRGFMDRHLEIYPARLPMSHLNSRLMSHPMLHPA